MTSFLAPRATIVHSQDFENAIVKIINQVPLVANETRAMQKFVAEGQSADDDECDFATSVLRQAKKPRRSEREQTTYDALVYRIPPTSNHCERLFSQCKLVLTPIRSSLHPANFEMITFLTANRDMWDAVTLLGKDSEQDQ
jgi:hypothetical protein